MNKLSFEIRSAVDLYGKLLREYDRFRLDPISTDHAINLCVTAHHLFKDWLRIELGEASPEYDQLKSMIETDLFLEVEIMRDICDGSKHVSLHRPPPLQVNNAETYLGGFSPGDFSSEDFDVSGLFVNLRDGSKLKFAVVVEKVMQFWKIYFATYSTIKE